MATKKRAAIYARFSSDLQRDRSIDDQVAVCRDYAARNGCEIVEVYSDRAASGASLHGRPGIQRLLADAKTGYFQAVLAESMSRIGRDQEDRAGIRKRLQFVNVELITPSDGVVTHLTDGIRAVIDSQYLEDLKGMIRRGMTGVVREGRHAGGRAYGYRPVPGAPGELAIVEDEARIIRRIFREYLSEATPREIAARLNAEAVSPPRGRHWTAATINGNAKRGHGILQNEIYAGRLVWNRVRMVKDPETGRRVSRPNPPDQWARAAVPHLRIVDDETFERAQMRRQSRSIEHAKPIRARRPRHLLSGLLRCGACSGGMQVKDTDHGRVRIICSTVKETGACTNRRAYYLDTLERAVTAGLKARLKEKDAIALYVKEYNAERQRLASEAVRNHGRLTSDLERAQARLERAVRGYADGILPEVEAKALVAGATEERDRLRHQLARAEKPPKVVSLHPETVARYMHSIEELERTLTNRSEGEHPASRVLRELIAEVVVHPAPTPEPFEIEVKGRLAALIGGAAYPSMKLRQNGSGGVMVAEDRLIHEPPTDIVQLFNARCG